MRRSLERAAAQSASIKNKFDGGSVRRAHVEIKNLEANYDYVFAGAEVDQRGEGKKRLKRWKKKGL